MKVTDAGRTPPALDRRLVRRHHVEFSYISGRYMVEHLVRLYHAFDGDLVAAIVLGTIGGHNARRFYDEVVARSPESYGDLAVTDSRPARLRPCNAMSVSAATGIPRETVRRKIRWLVEKGWVRQAGRDQLFVTEAAAAAFADFDTETVERLHEAAHLMMWTLQKVAALPAQRDPAQGGPEAPDPRGQGPKTRR